MASIRNRAAWLFVLVVVLFCPYLAYVYKVSTWSVVKRAKTPPILPLNWNVMLSETELHQNPSDMQTSILFPSSFTEKITDKKIKHVLDKTSCTNASMTNTTSPLVVCSRASRPFIRIVLLTTMYYSGQSKMFIQRNVIEQWAMLDDAVQPVLFLSDSSINTYPGFIEGACAKGWVVLKVPECNKHGFPILKSMVKTAEDLFPKSIWVGYANGDILFNKGLVRTLDYLHTLPDMKVQMVVGQRSDIFLKINQRLSSDADFEHMVNQTNLRGHHAIDYFITPVKGYPWHKIPPFVVGRSGFDTWLVWWTRAQKMMAVDATESIKAAHQGVLGKSQTANSHRSRSKGMHSNDPFMKGYSMLVGRTQCLRYKTQDLYNNPMLRFPIQLSKFNEEDLQQVLKYTIESATVRLLIEHHHNYSELYSPEVQLLLSRMNFTAAAFKSDTIKVTSNSALHNSLPSVPNKLQSNYSFLTEDTIRNVLTVSRNESGTDDDLKENSNIVLMERIKYPRHCKSLHDPRQIQVKIIHVQHSNMR